MAAFLTTEAFVPHQLVALTLPWPNSYRYGMNKIFFELKFSTTIRHLLSAIIVKDDKFINEKCFSFKHKSPYIRYEI